MKTSSCSRTSSVLVSHCHHLLVGDWNQLPCEVFQEATSKTTGGKPGNDGESTTGEKNPDEVCSQATEGTVVNPLKVKRLE